MNSSRRDSNAFHYRLTSLTSVFVPLSALIFLLLALEFASRLSWIPQYILPAPSEVGSALIEDQSELLSAFGQTAKHAVIGFSLSLGLGFTLGLLSILSNWVRLTLMPIAVFLQTVPIIAIAPLLVIWFGFGSPTVIASAFIVSLFPIISATTLGLRSVDPAYFELFQIYSATRWQTLLRLRIPFALPQFLSGMRISCGLAVIGAIVGEFIGGSGLGEVVDVARTQQRLDKVFAAVTLSAMLGFIFVLIIDAVSARLLGSWYGSSRSGASSTDGDFH